MHKKKIRNLLIPVFLSGVVLGSAGGITAEEMPADTETVSVLSEAEEEMPGEEGSDAMPAQETPSEIGEAPQGGEEPGSDTPDADEGAADTESIASPAEESVTLPDSEIDTEGTKKDAGTEETESTEAQTEKAADGSDAEGGIAKEEQPDKEKQPSPADDAVEKEEDGDAPAEEESKTEPDAQDESGPQGEQETGGVSNANPAGTDAEGKMAIRAGTGARVARKPVVTGDFRFWTVAKVYAFAKTDAFIREEKEKDAAKVGKLEKGDLCFVIHDEGDGWLYVESGEVRGFVQAALLSAEEDESAAEKKIKKAELSDGKQRGGLLAEPLMDKADNSAFAYIRATTEEVVADKVYALPKEVEVPVFDEKSEEGKKTGTLGEGDLAYVLIREDPWCFIESGDVRGFVRTDLLQMDVKGKVEEKGEESFGSAALLMEPSKNRALYYTIRSCRSGTPEGEIRESVVSYASQFIGNPYIWGGTDPVNGADCSGFVQTIYGKYGYELPRVAADQASAGVKVPVSEAREGDLLFSMDDSGSIYHVAICAGDGKTVEAASSETGIISGTVSPDACWAVRIIDDESKNSIPEEYEGHPVGTGTCYTVTHHYGDRNWGYACREVYDLWKQEGSVYTENCATIGDKYLIACTDMFGTVGDHITWYFDDGSSIESVMADTKSSGDLNYTPWGHITGSGIINVLEFETDELINPGREGCFPGLEGRRVTGWVNHGSVLTG